MSSLSVNLLLIIYGLLVAHCLVMYDTKQIKFMTCWALIVSNSWLFFNYLM
jgi:hypothetical protein